MELPDPGAPFQLGDRVGTSYRLLRLLGRGATSFVFEAEDSVLSRRVAIKVVEDAKTGAETLVHEAKALAATRHPGLPVVHGLGVHRGFTYLVLERLYGVTLDDHLARAPRRRLGLEEGLDVLLAVADVLAAVHRAGLAHRDLKPANVMLCAEGRTVLLDFGIVAPEVAARDVPRCGTPRYLAPEVILSQLVPGHAHLVDVYAFGALAYELFAGQPAFDADTMIRTLERHLADPAPDLADARPDLPPALGELLGACLAKAPADRPADMTTVSWELLGLRRRSQDRLRVGGGRG
jgi:serine/threonine protein kinase